MTSSRIRAYVGLGSNLHGPVDQITRAFEALARLPETTVDDRSPLYFSPPVGPAGQPEYVNAAAALDTGLAPIPLLRALQSIEQAHGRQRTVRWGPRSLDLDLLLYGNERIMVSELTIPHPHLHERAFVLVPLLALDPDLEIPGLGLAAHWAEKVGTRGLRPVPPDAAAP
jgi:2-amino-4-hydroxy-6-hydroxymethyldihydropteridine diphosphokinase